MRDELPPENSSPMAQGTISQYVRWEDCKGPSPTSWGERVNTTIDNRLGSPTTFGVLSKPQHPG